MEIVSTMTFDLQTQIAKDTNSSVSNSNSQTANNMATSVSSEMSMPDKGLDSTSIMAQLEAATQSIDVVEHRSPSEEARSPAQQRRTTEASSSVYHTPEVFSSPVPNVSLDLAKVRSALTELNAVVKEEEEHFFKQLVEAETANSQLRQHLVTTDELRDTNIKLEKSVEAAQIMMGKLQSESQARVESLTETLVSKDVEIARLQAEAEHVKGQLKKLTDANDEKLEKSVEAAQVMIGKLQTESQARVDSLTESLVSKDVEIAKLQAEAESVKAQLQKQSEATDELRETNLQMQKSVEAAQIMMSKVRAESQSRVDTLNQSLVARDVEIAKLQAEYKVMSESKETEMATIKKLLETQEEEGRKLREESKTSSESLIAQEASVSHLRTEFENLQAAFDAIKAEKEEIEQGHEDAKEKWKRLVITMKSEYDNFRASFDHLKASKKEMEETYSAEKNALAQEVSKLRAENASMNASIDSLKIVKEVSDNQYKEAATSWEKTKRELEEACAKVKKQAEEIETRLKNQLEEETSRLRSEKEEETTRLRTQHEEETTRLKTQHEEDASRLRTENDTLNRVNEELEHNWNEMKTKFDEKVRAGIEPTEKKFAAIMEEFGQVKTEMYSLELAKQDVEAENSELKSHIEQATQRSDGFKAELVTEVQEHTTLREKHEELEYSYKTKESECDALKSEVESLESAKEEVEKTLAALHADHKTLTDDLQTLKAEHEELLKEKAGAEERIATMESDNEAMSEAYAKVTSELEDIKAQLAEKVESEKELLAKVAAVEEEKSEAEKRFLTKLEAAAEEKAKADKRLKEQKSEAEKQLKSQKSEADKQLKNQKAQTEKELFDLKHELEAVTADFESSKAAMDGARIVHKDEKAKLEKKIAKLHKTVETKKEALSLGLAKYLKELKAKEKAEKHIGELKGKLEENDDMIKKHVADLEGAEKRIVALEDVIKFKDADHKKEMAKLNEKVEDSLNYEASQREAALQKQIEAENKVAEMEKVVSKTEAEILSAKCQNDSLREELEKAENGRQEAIANAESLSTNLKETEALLGEKVSELHSVKGNLAIAEQGKKKAKEELEQLKKKAMEDAEHAKKLDEHAKKRAKEELELVQKNAKEELEHTKAKAKKEADEMKQQINNLNKSVAKKIAAITALESKCETLKNTVDVSDSSAIDAVKKVDFLHQMIESKEKELELIKTRCASLQTALDKSEHDLFKKGQLEKELEDVNEKMVESRMLVEKKNRELLTLQERCDKLSASLKKAESLYLDGVETIKSEAEKKQREALEEATDRVYVLNGMLSKKEEELLALKETCEKLKSRARDDTSENEETKSEAEAQRKEEFKALVSKIDFLEGMVSSKNSELELIKKRCEGLQESITKMQENHEKHVALIRDEAEKSVTMQQVEKEAELKALNREIARKQSKLKSLKEGDEFEIILDNGDDVQLQDEVDALKKRCNGLEQELETARSKASTMEAAMKAESTEGAAQQYKLRCDELQASVDKLTQQLEDECERRKEAEQVFATLNQKPSDEPEAQPEPSKATTTRGVFSRSSKATTDTTDAKKPNRWLGLRGRKKREDLSVRCDEREQTRTISPARGGSRTISPARGSSPSKWRQYSPRRRAQDGTTPVTRPPVTIADKEKILAQIPAHIKSNFYEVGIYKQRLQNSYLPVLCLSPFDVPPGTVRDEWLSKFDGKSKVLNLGVYFLGKDGKDEGAYGTIPWFSFVPYSKAVQRGFDSVPKELAKKIEAGETLTVEEKQVRDGMKALKEAAAKSKEDRTHPLQRLAHARAGGDVPKCIVTDSSESADDQVSEMGI